MCTVNGCGFIIWKVNEFNTGQEVCLTREKGCGLDEEWACLIRVKGCGLDEEWACLTREKGRGLDKRLIMYWEWGVACEKRCMTMEKGRGPDGK